MHCIDIRVLNWYRWLCALKTPKHQPYNTCLRAQKMCSTSILLLLRPSPSPTAVPDLALPGARAEPCDRHAGPVPQGPPDRDQLAQPVQQVVLRVRQTRDAAVRWDTGRRTEGRRGEWPLRCPVVSTVVSWVACPRTPCKGTTSGPGRLK